MGLTGTDAHGVRERPAVPVTAPDRPPNLPLSSVKTPVGSDSGRRRGGLDRPTTGTLGSLPRRWSIRGPSRGSLSFTMVPGPRSNTASGKDSGAHRIGFALRFISGKYQGGEYPLEEGAEVVIGRSSELDMVLVEELVSRKHARIMVDGGVISVEDLGSTNGTFVNGERIRKATLREGDRVLVGTSILKLVAASIPRMATVEEAEGSPGRSFAKMRTITPTGEESPRMTGNLEEIPLPDLLQLFGNSKKTGVLVVRTADQRGSIHLKQGDIHFALIEGKDSLDPFKAVYRMLQWTKGVFELEPPADRQFEKPIDRGVQEILMESFRQHDEFGVVSQTLPPMDQRLALRLPLVAPLHELEPSHLEVLQLALNCANLESVLDRSASSDLDTGRILASLLSRGYLQVAPNS